MTEGVRALAVAALRKLPKRVVRSALKRAGDRYVLQQHGWPVIVTPTMRGTFKAAEILGVSA